MKKIFLISAVFCLVFLASCSFPFKKLSAMEKVQKTLLEMENYQCRATLTRVSNKGEEVYETVQYYKNTGQYRLEILSPESIAGNYTVYDGDDIDELIAELNKYNTNWKFE